MNSKILLIGTTLVTLALAGCGASDSSTTTTSTDTQTAKQSSVSSSSKEAIPPGTVTRLKGAILGKPTPWVEEIKEVEIERAIEKGRYQIEVKFVAKSGGNSRDAIYYAMEHFYKNIYTSKYANKIQRVDLDAHLSREYKSQFTDAVYFAVMSNSAAKKVDWDNIDSVDLTKVWNVIHDEIPKKQS